MATFEVTIETIEVFPHPNADRLELARVGLYNIVVGKDNWKTGDKVLYIPEYAVLPETLIVKLGLEGKLAGPEKNRVKPAKLRGALSQGLVAPLDYLPSGVLEERGEKADFSDVLEITKWEPPVPLALAGETEGNYNLVNWIDIENLKKFPDMFTEGEPVIVDEKIHGTATLMTFANLENDEAEVLVSSKGLGARKLVLKETDNNVYWRSLRKFNLEALAAHVKNKLEFPDMAYSPDTTNHHLLPRVTVEKIGLFGETFGSVQDLKYGYKNGETGFALFDIYVVMSFIDEDHNTSSWEGWLDANSVREFAEATQVPLVPRLYEGPFSMSLIEELANGKEQVSGTEAHIREGVVVRPVERKGGHEKIGKFVSEAYLTRKGTNGEEPTEFN